MKVVLLDIDGVLNSKPYLDAIKSGKKGDTANLLSEYHLEMLSKIYKACDAKIVITSTWKDRCTSTAIALWEYLLESLKKFGMSVYHVTPDLESNRPAEISAWLKEHEGFVESYVILDDNFSREQYAEYGLEEHLVQTKFWCHAIAQGGLQQEHVDKAIAILNGGI